MNKKFYNYVAIAFYFISIAIMAIFSLVYLHVGWRTAPTCVKELLLSIVVVANIVGGQLMQNELERILGIIESIDEEES